MVSSWKNINLTCRDGKNWFTNRVVDDWNRLSYQIVNSNSIDSFKRTLDKFMDEDNR